MGLYPGEDDWSSEYLQQAIAKDPSLALGRGKGRSQDYVVNAMAHAITGEFIDLENMSCHFERPDFTSWLGLMKSLIGDPALAEDRIAFTCAVDSYYSMRALYASMNMGDAGRIAGFPNSKGGGFYLASPAAVVAIEGEYKGMNTSCSVAAGCKAPDAAWGFIKILLNNAHRGIPVLRSAFEELMEYNVRAYSMDPRDVDVLRDIAENASGAVVADPALIELISSTSKAYLAGDISPEDAAAQLQSRVSIYLSEQS